MTRLAAVAFFVISLMFVGQSDAKIDPESCVGMWLFDEDNGDVAQDSSGNGNDGTLLGNPNKVEGRFGDCLEFDGNDDYVDCGNAESLDIFGADAQITIVLWVNTPDVSRTHGALVTKGEWCAGYSLLINGNTKTLLAADLDPQSGGLMTNDEWYHLAATTDGATGELKFYINGELSEVNKKNVNGIAQSNMPVNIAREQFGGGRWYFKGMIDDVGIFNVVLTKDDIKDIMNKGLSSAATAVSTSGKLTSTWGDIRGEKSAIVKKVLKK